MDAQTRRAKLDAAKAFFDKSTACLTDADGAYRPQEGMFTTAEHIAHTAQTVEWFLDGAWASDGFSRDFEALERSVSGTSMADARAWLDRAFQRASGEIQERSDEEWAALIADPEIMSGCPRWAILGGIADHCAHHRGALTVYARLRGHTPEMPY